MSELHKPGTPGPWASEAIEATDVEEGYRRIYAVSDDDLRPYVAETVDWNVEDAQAIADLWGWIERAERYEEALQRILEAPSEWSDVEMWAVWALREGGGDD